MRVEIKIITSFEILIQTLWIVLNFLKTNRHTMYTHIDGIFQSQTSVGVYRIYVRIMLYISPKHVNPYIYVHIES